MQGTPARGRVLAKTGTPAPGQRARRLRDPRGGDRLAFAIVLNHHTAGGAAGTAAIDEIVARW